MGMFSTVGDILSTVGGVQYRGRVPGKSHFYREGELPKIWGSGTFLRSKGGIKRFFQIKKGVTYIFKKK